MTIHDELVLALTRPNEKGDVPIVGIVGTSAIRYRIEESTYLTPGDQPDFTAPLSPQPIVPDITIWRKDERKPSYAIEVETDIDFDFGASLRQVKRYRKDFPTAVVVIAKEYERFVLLYKNEGFRVCVWRATRVWECMRCGNWTTGEGPVPPKCTVKDCGSREQRLKGIRNAEFVEA